MSLSRVAVFATLVAVGSLGCMSTRPPQELVDARAAYARAYVGPAAQANVPGLHDAQRALEEAEAKFADDPRSEEARHLAYLAHRRVLLAETHARSILAANQRVQAEHAVATMTKARPQLSDPERSEDQQKARTAPAR